MHSFPPKGNEAQAQITPLGQRLITVLRHVGNEYDEARMLLAGLERMVRKNTWSDDEIHDTLTLVRDHIGIILGDTAAEETA